VILQTLASLVILGVTAGPGRVFERRVDARRPRHFRSTFAEYIELVVIGAVLTLAAVGLVLLVAGLIEILFGAKALDLDELFNHPGDYAKSEPWRIVLASFAAIAGSFGLAFVVPPIIVKEPKDHEGAGYYEHSAWLKNFLEEKPESNGVAIAAQFKDGYKAVGILTGFTPTQTEDREMVLQKLKIGSTNAPLRPFPADNFLIIRESQISWMVGEYVAKTEDGEFTPPD
jgi:uncharacterized protein DUF6338